ncbi:MAG: hybrid sensor histidine kinase/response regulator [Gammaproteobacteria bacterium]
MGSADEAHRRLRESERLASDRLAQLEAMYDSAPIGLAYYDTNLHYVRINDRLAAINGKRPEEHIGKSLEEILPREIVDQVVPSYRHVLDTGETITGLEVTGETAGRPGVTRSWLVNCCPARDVSGSILGLCVTVEDFTDRIRAQESLMESDRRKNEFLAILGHELRNPLAGIANGIRLIASPDRDKVTADWTVAMMKAQVEQLTSLLDDLLDVTRIAQGKITLNRRRVRIEPVLRRAVESARPLIDEMAHQLDIDFYGAPDACVYADPTRVEQIFSNLLTNAAKYTSKGGQISLKAGIDGEDVLVRVVDNGIGIPKERLESIFDAFTQIRSESAGQGGLGIGLTLVRQLTALHGGQVTVHSDGPGRGSEFMVRLALATETPARQVADPTGKAGACPDPGLRVLVVDDNVDAAQSLSMLLEMQGGCRTETAFDGASALEAARSFQPDALVLDIKLPDMSGYRVAQLLRGDAELRDALLIALSGFGHQEATQASRAAGFDHHLTKPVSVAELLDVLAKGRAAASS